MAADQYCLKWNNHQSTLLVQFETLLESDSLTDCTLSAEGKYLNVHKVLLSACSPYFSKLLGEHKDKHPIFFMKDVAFEELKGIVEYMYKGEVNVMQERLDSFLKTASSLQIKGLADQDGGKGEDREEDPGGGRAKRKQAPDLRGGYGESSPMPEEPPRSPKRRRRPRPVSQDDSLPAQDQNHCDTTTAPAFSQLQQQEVVMPTPLVPVKKTEPVDNSMVHLKTEIPDDVPQVDVQDLTLDDDEDFNNEDITQPGTSFSETSQDFAQWQQQMATQSGADESFMAASQGINQSGSQEGEKGYEWKPHMLDPKPHSCEFCGRTYRYLHNLERHRRMECGKEASHVCPICPYRSKHKHNLMRHFALRHAPKGEGDINAQIRKSEGNQDLPTITGVKSLKNNPNNSVTASNVQNTPSGSNQSEVRKDNYSSDCYYPYYQ